jgi:uncharacterized protein (TIGR02391 family)
MITRPVPKEILKKMFLKVLWEHKRPGGKFASHGSSVGAILDSTLPFYFELKNDAGDDARWKKWSLTKQERDDALLGVEELQRDGFLRNDPDQGSPDHKTLTEKGLQCAVQDLADMKLPSVDIEKVLSRGDLLNRVRGDYLNGEYDSAILKAFKQVEEAVRAKAKQPPSVTGHDLMVAAFAPSKGGLKSPEAKTASEEQALFFLFDGANGWFRNPTAHRTVGYQDPHEAAQILALANLLLDMVDTCV